MELFEDQVDRSPGQEALIDGHRRLTYRELEMRSNQLAHRLTAAGVGPEVLVGICMQRSAEMVVGVLGILKAGGAYVPLDPAYPKDRLAIVLEDAQVPVLLTNETELGCLPQLANVETICLDREKGIISQESTERPRRRATARNLAYIIYTSGSTGRPKGVAIEHSSAVTFVMWAGEVFSREELTAVLASTSLCFDLSVFEIFVPLSCGGTVVVARNALQLPSLPASQEVTLINTVPSAMAELVRMDAIPERVRTVNLAGEPLKNTLVQRVYARKTVERVYNLYGPSEDTTYSTFALVPRGGTRAPTIGRPIANSQTYILDAQMHPVPAGEVGELYIGGAGLARGYLNRPDVTAERFVPDPFGGEPGGRLYTTGDLARLLPDGEIDFLGRADHQVKLRGFRIELGEIEVLLEQQRGVREAVVIVREDIPEDKRLVAYVVPDAGARIEPREIRNSLKQKLPEYMLPPAIVVMNSLPLTPNGKVNRLALPAPDWSACGDHREHVGPRTPVEEVLAGVFAEVLGIQRVSVRDNFFEIGGHSLLATRVISRIRSAFGAELPQGRIFDAPTVEALAEAVETALRAGTHDELPPLKRAAREGRDRFPLSFAQQGLWFLDQLAPDSAAYNIPYKVDMTGPLDVSALRSALNEIVKRHEALRTTFHLAEDNPFQRIHPPRPLTIPFIDLSCLSATESEDGVRRMEADEARRLFDLRTGPLMRVVLLRLGREKHKLLLTMHHIVGDDWSSGVLFSELATLYKAFSSGMPSPLPDLPIQPADFALWQRESYSADRLKQELSYWRQRLAGAQGVLELATDRPRPPVRTFSGAAVSLALPPALGDAIKSLCQQEGVTLFMLLMAAFKAFLHRHTGQSDIIVGTPIAARTRAEIEGLISFFVNTLALRTDLSGDPSFRALLRRVRETALSAYSHQDAPIERLVNELQPVRDPSRSPLVQVMFALQNPPADRFDIGPLTLRVAELHNGSSKLDLTLFVKDAAEGLAATVEYNTDLFDRDTVVRMLENFRTMLDGVVANPDQRLSELPVLSAAERHRLLVEWNDTRSDYPKGDCLHNLVELQAKRIAGAAAVVCDHERLTYRELNARANQLAHHLRGLGVGPEVRVGLCTERSANMVIGLLAILKAGGAYVPLDPAYPKERVAFMLRDSQAAVLITTERLLDSLPRHDARILCLDRDAESILWRSREDVRSGVCPQNLAYLIYTSGSTGVPKAVAIEHRSAVTFVHWVRDNFSDQELAGVLASTSICFDLSVFEIFGTLGLGGKVILADNALHLPALAAAREVTLINTVPSAMAELLRIDSIPASVGTVNLAGEPLTSSLVQQLYSKPAIRRVLNLYGPSEDTTYSTSAVLRPDDGRAPSIGRPIAGTQVYLLDDTGRPVPQGVPGELCIGGEGLARCYLGRPDLTAARFVPNPFSGAAGARMYRTGDLARYQSDGNIEFLGRLDHQVKIRGFRIEPGEIEAAIAQHRGVRETVVVAQAGGPAEGRLIAYVVPAQNPPPTTREIRQFLGQKLPEPLLPSVFVFLRKLPRTPNGKIDRSALPAPDPSGCSDAAPAPPRTETEERLSEIYQQVLSVDRVGIHDNFFEIGGHSLLATQVLSRVRSVFRVDLPLRKVFSAPTVAGLSEQIEAAQWASQLLRSSLAAVGDREEGVL
ncbi:MAG: amino acid adenylation domain-containing protein [Acidobacteriota bacterium]